MSRAVWYNLPSGPYRGWTWEHFLAQRRPLLEAIPKGSTNIKMVLGKRWQDIINTPFGQHEDPARWGDMVRRLQGWNWVIGTLEDWTMSFVGTYAGGKYTFCVSHIPTEPAYLEGNS